MSGARARPRSARRPCRAEPRTSFLRGRRCRPCRPVAESRAGGRPRRPSGKDDTSLLQEIGQLLPVEPVEVDRTESFLLHARKVAGRFSPGGGDVIRHDARGGGPPRRCPRAGAAKNSSAATRRGGQPRATVSSRPTSPWSPGGPGAPFGDRTCNDPARGEGGGRGRYARTKANQPAAVRSMKLCLCCAGWDRTALLCTVPRRPHSVVGRGGSG